MSPQKYLAVVALAVGMVTDSWSTQLPNPEGPASVPERHGLYRLVRGYGERASRAVDIIDGKGCVEVNKGEMVEFERLLTNPFVVCVRPIGQPQCFWTSPFAISPQPRKR
jgi:hypothetical protein